MHLPTAPSERILAHPVSGHPHVDVPVLALTVGAGLLVAAVLLALPARAVRESDAAPPVSWEGGLTRGEGVGRGVAGGLLVLAVLAALFGSRDQLENLAPALVVGVAWPVLFLLALALPVWRWVDPWDGAARLLVPGDRSDPSPHVWPALVPALGWAWFIAVNPRPLDPRGLGIALIAYATFVLAGCVMAGRKRWLSAAEPLGLLLSWARAAVRGGLRADVPRGAAALVGATLGGLLFGLLVRTETWTGITGGADALAWGTAGFAACALLGALLLVAGDRFGRRTGDEGAVLRGALPLLVAAVLVLATARNRFTTSLQLLPGLAGDPFGAGWDLLGPAGSGLEATPFGAAGLLWLRIALLGLLLGVAAVVAARGSRPPTRTVAAVVLPYLGAVSMLLVTLH